MKTWRERVEAELGGADFERTLVDRAFAGVPIAPLYTARDLERVAVQEDVGCFPFVRGSRAVTGRRPWFHAPRYDLVHPKVLNRALLADLEGGTDALWLQLDACVRLGVPPTSATGREAWGDGGCMLWTLEDWRQAFSEVQLQMVHLELDAGANTLSSLALLLVLLQERGIDPASLSWNLGLDPLGSLARDGSLPLAARCMKHQLGDLLRWSGQHMPASRALMISTEVHHGAGASLVQELGIMAATLVHYLQLMESISIPVDRVAASIALRMVVDRDLFPAVAGLRAARRLWSRVLEACGLDPVPAPWIHAVGSRRALAQRDPWTNQLRVGTQTFAAILGGAQSITTCTFDEVLGQPSELGRRVARNTQIILAEESRLGEVADPVGGAFLFESLTDSLCVEAWEFFQQIEREGGMAVVLRSGWLHRVLGVQQQQRRADLSTRRLPMTGVSSFPPTLETLPEVVPYLGHEEEEWAARWQASEPCVMRVEQGVEDLITAARSGCDVFALTAAQRDCMASSCDGPQVEPLLLQRDAEVFEHLVAEVEALVQRGVQPEVLLLAVGAQAQAEARMVFAESLFATAGLPTRRISVATRGLLCLCGSEAAYEESLAQELIAAREAAVQRILITGRPRGSGLLELCTAAGVEDFLDRETDIPRLVHALLEVYA